MLFNTGFLEINFSRVLRKGIQRCRTAITKMKNKCWCNGAFGESRYPTVGISNSFSARLILCGCELRHPVINVSLALWSNVRNILTNDTAKAETPRLFVEVEAPIMQILRGLFSKFSPF